MMQNTISSLTNIISLAFASEQTKSVDISVKYNVVGYWENEFVGQSPRCLSASFRHSDF